MGLNNPPDPLIDPDRIVWETSLISAYTDCAIRHKMTVEAWSKLVKP